MSLPTTADLATLQFVSNGQPHAPMQPSTAYTTSLAFVFAGQPFYAQGGVVVAPPASSARPVCFVCT